MSRFTTKPTIVPLDKYDTTTIEPGTLGTMVESGDSKKYRLVKFAEAVTAGHAVQAPAVVADFENLATVAPDTDLTATEFAVGEDKITVTLGATPVDQDELVGDTLIINDGDGEGYTYTIRANSAGVAVGKCLITLEEDIAKDIVIGSSEVSIIKNKYNGVIVMPVAATGPVVGVAVRDYDADDYGWVQTGGYGSVVANGAAAVNAAVYASTTVAGAVEAGLTANFMGYAVQALVDTEYRTVDLKID